MRVYVAVLLNDDDKITGVRIFTNPQKAPGYAAVMEGRKLPFVMEETDFPRRLLFERLSAAYRAFIE